MIGIDHHAPGGECLRTRNSGNGHLRSIARRLHAREYDGRSWTAGRSYSHLAAGDGFRRVVHARHCSVRVVDIYSPLTTIYFTNPFEICLK